MLEDVWRKKRSVAMAAFLPLHLQKQQQQNITHYNPQAHTNFSNIFITSKT